MRLVTRAIGYIDIDGVRVNAGDSITVPSGDHKVKVVTTATAGFPSIYINSKYLKTGADWCADHGAFERIPVGKIHRILRTGPLAPEFNLLGTR